MRILCPNCGKNRTNNGMCSVCKGRMQAKADHKSPYREKGDHATSILGWEPKGRKR